MLKWLGLAIFVISPWISAQAETYDPKLSIPTGPMQVEPVNGTDFKDTGSGKVYRLYGIASCALDQRATYGKVTWPCGIKALSWLVDATLAKWIVCTPVKDQDTVTLARCATHDNPDVALTMLKEGLVVVSNDPEQQAIADYKKAQQDAQFAHLGLWSSQFTMPWDFKKP